VFILAIGVAKPDTKFKPAMCSDVILVGNNRNSEPVGPQRRARGAAPARPQNAGHSGVQEAGQEDDWRSFARFALPILSLGAMFETLAISMPGLVDGLSAHKRVLLAHLTVGSQRKCGRF
jgi:hypothetical protein